MKYPGFIGASDASQSVIADGEITMNWYLEQLPPFATSRFALYPSPGFQTFLSVTDLNCRGSLSVNGRTFVVWGTGLYEIFATQTATKLGTVVQDNNPATISSNGITGGQLFITSGTNGYCYTLATSTLTLVLTGDATMGGMLDGYFIAFNVSTSRIRISALNDGTTWDPTQFASRSAASDPWKAMVVVQQPAGIWLVGEQTGDVWYDSGAFPFPLAPIPGANYRFGTPAPFSVKVLGDRVTWLSQNADGAGVIVSARGYSPSEISVPSVETAIQTYARTAGLTDAEAFTYQDQGHSFYVLTFPAANATWVYDQSISGLTPWHQRSYWNNAMNREDYWHPRTHVFAFGKHLVGERATGILSEMDTTFGSEADGTAIRRRRRAAAVFNENQQILMRRFELFLESGLGLISGQGSAPIVMMRTSDNGGKTWLPERTASAGAQGNYGQRVFWTRLGIPRDRVIEITVSDPIPWRILEAFINNDDRGRRAA